MNPAAAQRLIAINREFYNRFGASFSASRRRLQPGVCRMLDSLKGDESILDLGCGNGELARALAKCGHRGPYLGLDFSLPLLQEAESQAQGAARSPGPERSAGQGSTLDAVVSRSPEHSEGSSKGFSARFLQADLTQLSTLSGRLPITDRWSLITAFATLHHIPGNNLRREILHSVHELLAEDGRFIHSNWQFLNSDKLRARIQPWDTALISPADIDAGDYLLDWRNGGRGLRYVHHFSEQELNDLARLAGFRVTDCFYSDGQGGKLGLYQTWQKRA